MMQLTFLGTSAANAFPEPFCHCPNCQQARQHGGRSLRKRCAALINDDLLIDLGPDIMSAAHQHGRPLTNVQYCLQTHPHADHVDLSHLQSRSPEYGTQGAPLLNWYLSEETFARVANTFQRDLSHLDLHDPQAQDFLNIRVHTVRPFESFQCGRYEIMPLPANHAHGMGALLYLIMHQDRTIFYATDTAEFFPEVWEYLADSKTTLDIMVIDHTYGPQQSTSDHLCAQDVAAYAGRMRNEGILKAGGRILATHISHEGNPAHPQLSAYAYAHGYEIAHDGLTV